IGKINVDQNPDLAGRYNVMSIPTLIVFKNGKEHARAVGYRPKQDILAMIP
ncbi:MAG: thioredoxin family protein, partial [Lachnospiraceae bacterium]|nr:thioredoxin family protein [Lachnospiraceae bacterium]